MAKKPIDLDEEYGDPARPHELDPSHLRALAARIGTLASEIETIRSDGHRRAEQLAVIDDKVDGLRRTVDVVDAEVEDLLRTQITSEDMKTLSALIAGHKTLSALIVSHDTRGRVWRWVRKWAVYISATATFVWLMREPISAVLKFLGRIGG